MSISFLFEEIAIQPEGTFISPLIPEEELIYRHLILEVPLFAIQISRWADLTNDGAYRILAAGQSRAVRRISFVCPVQRYCTPL